MSDVATPRPRARRTNVPEAPRGANSRSRFARMARRMVCDTMPAPILPLIEATAHWPARGALVGLDLGTKTIGVAVSDPDRRLATGVETIARKNFTADAARLLVIAKERNVAGFALGLPINMDGSEGPRAKS